MIRCQRNRRAALFFARPCRNLCPMGGFLGLINRIGWFRVRRNNAVCTHCMACSRVCPVNIKVESVDQVQSAECINCNLCVSACPVKGALVIGGPRRAGRVFVREQSGK